MNINDFLQEAFKMNEVTTVTVKRRDYDDVNNKWVVRYIHNDTDRAEEIVVIASNKREAEEIAKYELGKKCYRVVAVYEY